jgi:hypothetical protein
VLRRIGAEAGFMIHRPYLRSGAAVLGGRRVPHQAHRRRRRLPQQTPDRGR